MSNNHSQALKPDNFVASLPVMQEKEANPQALEDDEIQLAAMSRTNGWAVLREYIERIANELDAANEEAIANGADFEKLGRNVLIISQSKGVLKKILDKVADAKEASEKPKATRKK